MVIRFSADKYLCIGDVVGEVNTICNDTMLLLGMGSCDARIVDAVGVMFLESWGYGDEVVSIIAWGSDLYWP